MDYQTLETIVDKLRNILDLPQKEIPAALDDFVHNQEIELAYMQMELAYMEKESQMNDHFEGDSV